MEKAIRKAAIFFLVILALYPLRHIGWGLDFWDTGYNYANFQYMGLGRMDPMWLFSTYLANVVGSFLTRLPFGDCLRGMNFYTGLFVSLLAVGGYFFCVKRLSILPWIAFLGEIAAISLCWCPTALLYNYLTYVLFLACVMLLYEGLVRGERKFLFGAGLCLGINVLVRFSNLPEAVLIVAVWAYGVIEALEEGKHVRVGGQAGRPSAENPENAAERGQNKGALRRTIWRTLWCLGGYLTALGTLLFYVQHRYGLGTYVEGIRRLFVMTDNAPDYKATSMLMGMFDMYLENLYWAGRILLIVAVGTAVSAAGLSMMERAVGSEKSKQMARLLRSAGRFIWCAVSLSMLGWLYYRGFCSPEYRSYGAILRPGVLFLMLAMGIAAIRIFHPRSPKEEKLISGLLILVILLTSIGSNNKLYPSLNNLFLAAPYTLWQSYRFFGYVGDGKWKGITFSFFPAKGILAAFLVLFLVQSVLFGANFVFAEATGVQETSAEVENNTVLRGVRMSPERAKWLSEISGYVSEKRLAGRDVILYGQIPAMSYYLQMPAAFHPWSELASYDLEIMRGDMEKLRERMREDASCRPVVILEAQFILYWQEGKGALETLGVEKARIQKIESLMENGKWQLIEDFLRDYGYQNTFRNEKFGVWEM